MTLSRQSKTRLIACVFFVVIASLAPPPHRSVGRAARQGAAAQPPRTIHVTVETEDGTIIGRLGPEAFGVFDGETQARVVSFSPGGEPATVGLVLDASGSMMAPNRSGSMFARVRGGLLSLLATAGSSDEFFLVVFNEQPQLLLRDTSDRAVVLAAFDLFTAVRARGKTALYDALYLAVNHASNGRHRKRVLVVVTDGHDSVSKFTDGNVKRALREGDVILYVIHFDPRQLRDGLADVNILQDMTDLTGGKLYQARNETQVEAAMKLIALELRRQYAIGIVPAPPKRKDGWHEIEVRMAKGRDLQGGKLHKLRARTRKGFY